VIGVGNGDPSSHEPDKASERSAFNGLCMAIVQSKRGAAGSIAVAVSSEGLEAATVAVSSSPSSIPAVD
jgi:beta-galactosidase